MSMQSILSAGMALNRMQVVQSANTSIQGRANVLKAEIKLEGGNEKKEKEVEGLEEQSTALSGNLMEELKGVNQVLKPEEDETAQKGEVEKNPENTDRVELSGHPEDGEKKTVSSAEAVSYTPEGVQPQEALKGEKIDTKA